MEFLEKLIKIEKKNKSIISVGLDTDILKIPPFLLKEKSPVLAFNRAIIDATRDLVSCYKINTAFYEGISEGWKTLRKTREFIPEKIPVIADAKRGDIGNTTKMYAKVFFNDMGFDAITINPYMGFDSVEPFLEYGEKCVFILCLTSNPGSHDFQLIFSDGKYLYEKVAEKAVEWNTQNNIGLVVGATNTNGLKRVRGIAQGLPILVPGIGAQGGDILAVIRSGGEPLIINSSRAIIYASKRRDFAEMARQETMKLRKTANQI